MLTNCLAVRANLTITISEIQRDICEKIVILSYPLAFDAPVRGFPSEYRHPLWDGKTRMVSLPEGEKISKICLFVLTWSTNVTDGRTDRQTLCDSIDRACIASRGKNRHFYVPRPSFFVCPRTPLRQSRKMLHEWKDNSVLAKPLAASTHLSLTVSQLFEPQVQKIAVFTYRSPHFCFPWGRPLRNHAKCYMDGKRIGCLQIDSLHVPI